MTGEPGSGKTHTVNRYVSWLRLHGIEPAITASTGIAATHIGGMTLHSWSGIGIKSRLSAYDLDRIAGNERVAKRIKNTRILIIDEVSMLLPETLSMVEMVCREILQNPRPFGGLQLLFVGDFFQLPPIMKKEPETEDSLFSDVEEAQSKRFGAAQRKHFAYQSPAWPRANPIVCYLTEQHRQDDADFLGVLSAIRRNEFAPPHMRHIEKRKIGQTTIPLNVPKLFSHNADVDRINAAMLAKLPGQQNIFDMEAEGAGKIVETLVKTCLSPEKLSLKIGAAVMCTKNNLREGFVNGTLGVVKEFSKFSGYPVIKTRSGREIEVQPMEWMVEENGKVRARVKQIPLRLAWAITVHKSQGMSLDEAVMDLSDVFEFGQGYVALSRVRRLSGLHILGWNARTFQVHPEVLKKDADFRAQSDQAGHAFSEMPSQELSRMHEQFIRACGGNNSARLSTSASTAVHVGARADMHRNINPPQMSDHTGKPYAKIREKYPSAYQSWTKEHDIELQKLFAQKIPVIQIAKTFGRKTGAIRSRLMKLGLIENHFKNFYKKKSNT